MNREETDRARPPAQQFRTGPHAPVFAALGGFMLAAGGDARGPVHGMRLPRFRAHSAGGKMSAAREAELNAAPPAPSGQRCEKQRSFAKKDRQFHLAGRTPGSSIAEA
jgi:hypothetical protein